MKLTKLDVSSGITVLDLTNFVLANRKNKAFHNWTPAEISETLYQAGLNKEMGFVVSAADCKMILGIAHGYAHHKEKVFHVSNVLIKEGSIGVFKNLIELFDSLFPGYKIEGTRYGNIKHYDTPRFKRLITHIT